MSTFKVDKEQINDSVETLKKLLEECEEAYNKEIPESTQDKGQTHDELNELCNTLKTTCYRFGELISKTIQFLGESSEMFEESDKTSATAIAADISNSAIQPRHTGYNHNSINKGVASGMSSDVLKNDNTINLSNDIKDVSEVFEYIDNQYSNLPMWIREHLKSLAKEAFGNGVGAYEITQMLTEGDIEGAIKKLNETLSKDAGDAISTIITGSPELKWDQKLLGKYVVNSIWGGVEAYTAYWKDPSLTNLGNVLWSSTIGSALETAGDQAYSVVSHIPGISNWYEEKGATDMGSMFNVAYSEWTKAIFGEETGEYVSTYYANNGGLFKGLVNGFSTIKEEVAASCEKHGGLLGVWKSGWNSIFD